MSPVEWVTDIEPSKCKSLWAVKNKPALGRIQYQCVKQAYHLDSTNYKELVFSHRVSVQYVDSVLKQCCDTDIRYVFLAVNKFLVYTETDLPEVDTSYDQALLDHWQSVTGWTPVYQHYINNDRGIVGNFDFPVTQMLLERND